MQAAFTPFDVAVLIAYIAGVTAFGALLGRKQHGSRDYAGTFPLMPNYWRVSRRLLRSPPIATSASSPTNGRLQPTRSPCSCDVSVPKARAGTSCWFSSALHQVRLTGGSPSIEWESLR